MFDQKTRTAIKINTNNFGDGLAGRGPRPQQHDRRTAPARQRTRPGAAQPRRAARPTCASCSWPSTGRPRRPRPWPRPHAAYCTDLDTFFTAWAGCRAVARSGYHRRAAVAGTGDPLASRRGALLENATEFMHLLRPSAHSLVTVAPPLGHAFTEGAVNLAAATALNTQLAESAQALADLRRTTRRDARPRRLHPYARSRQPAARRRRALAGRLQLLDARVPQRRQPASPRTSASARSRAPASCSPRPGPTTRATHPRRRPTDRRLEQAFQQHNDHRQQPPAREPLPERLRPRPADGVRIRQRDLHPETGSDRQRARRRRRQGNREFTSREHGPVRRNLPERNAQGPRHQHTKGKKQMSDTRWWRRHDEMPVVRARAARAPCASRS